MNLPNSVTFLRILFIPLIVYFLLSAAFPYGRTIAVVIFAVVALSDYLDGYLARKLKQETALGKLLDPLADKILVISALLCLVGLGEVWSVPVIIILVRDFAVDGLRMAAASSGRIIAADRLGKLKTLLLDVAVVMLMAGIPYGGTILWFGVLLAVVSGIEYFRRNMKWANRK